MLMIIVHDRAQTRRGK